jgi:hypothetical protein
MARDERGSMGAEFRAFEFNPQFRAVEFSDAGFFLVFRRYASGCAGAESGAAVRPGRSQ